MIPSARRKIAFVISVVASSVVAGLAMPGGARAQEAAPTDRCEGTLCDLYYGGPRKDPQPSEQPAAAKPLMVPSGGIMGFFSGGNSSQQPGASAGTPAKRPLVGVGGGGLAAMARGEAPERCSGTLCDVYYGGPPPEKPEPQAAQPPAVDQQAAVDAVPNPDPSPAQSSVRYRPLPEEKAGCAAKAHDPWSCYR